MRPIVPIHVGSHKPSNWVIWFNVFSNFSSVSFDILQSVIDLALSFNSGQYNVIVQHKQSLWVIRNNIIQSLINQTAQILELRKLLWLILELLILHSVWNLNSHERLIVRKILVSIDCSSLFRHFNRKVSIKHRVSLRLPLLRRSSWFPVLESSSLLVSDWGLCLLLTAWVEEVHASHRNWRHHHGRSC